MLAPLVTGAVQVSVTGVLPPGPRVPPEGLAEAISGGVTAHVIELPPRFETVIGVVEGFAQFPASTLVGVTLSAAGEGVAVGRGVALRVGGGVAVCVAVGLGVGLAPGLPGDGVAVGDVPALVDVSEGVPTAVVLSGP